MASAVTKPTKLIVVLGSVRNGRMADRVLPQAQKIISSLGHSYEVIDPKELKVPLIEGVPLHWHPDKTQAPEWLQETETKMLSGDAFVFLACEYNRNVGPALCNFIDYFGQNVFVSKPCGIVSYSMGSTGGVYGRSSLAQMLMDLTGVVVPATCQIPNVHSLLAEDGSFTDASSDQAKRTEKSMTKVINQTAWFANAFKNHKASYGDLPN